MEPRLKLDNGDYISRPRMSSGRLRWLAVSWLLYRIVSCRIQISSL